MRGLRRAITCAAVGGSICLASAAYALPPAPSSPAALPETAAGTTAAAWSTLDPTTTVPATVPPPTVAQVTVTVTVTVTPTVQTPAPTTGPAQGSGPTTLPTPAVPTGSPADGTGSADMTGSGQPAGSTGTATADVVPVPIARFVCPPATVTVATAAQLRQALATAAPGQVIDMLDGTYAGTFTTAVNGTTTAPIYLCGGRGAILEGTSTATGYGLHLQGVAHWRIAGFTVRGSQKGVVLDASSDVALQDLAVEDTGDEGVHLRDDSTGDVVRDLTISDTGLLDPAFGEGIYVGTAESNWAVVTDGQPDRSDHDYLVDNSISRTTAESIDVKEGTTSGVVAGNRFDGAGMTAATAWVNVKGNGWTIIDNTGTTTPQDGYQTHVVLTGWGQDNLFTGNTADLSGNTTGVGIDVQDLAGNQISCTTDRSVGRPLTNLSCPS